MKIDEHWTNVEARPVDMEDAEGVQKRVIHGPAHGTPHVAMRVFTLAPGGHTPYHEHPFEHQNVVLEGTGVIRTPEGDHPVRAGSTALILPGEVHSFRNTGDGPFSFVCLVPNDYA
jgi:quercetin dioxygenase-like cupin family protein